MALWRKKVVPFAEHHYLLRPPPISGATHGASVTTRRVEILCSLCSLRASRLLPLQILGLFLVVQTLTQT
jgi:hypothetical protein